MTRAHPEGSLDALLDVVTQHREDLAHRRVELLLEEQRRVLGRDLLEAAGVAAVDARVTVVRDARAAAGEVRRPAARLPRHQAACALPCMRRAATGCNSSV